MAEKRDLWKTDLCVHAGCYCMAPAGGDYCSDYCSLDEDDLEIGCGCGHPSCEMAEPPSQDKLREAEALE